MKLLKLDIPSGVQHITDEMVFKHKSIKKLSIPQSVFKIDRCAFYNRRHLETVYFETNSKLTVISESCFENNTSLRKIKLPDMLITIEKYAFKNCTAIDELILPDSVIHVDPTAFDGWKQHQTIYTKLKLKKPITCKANVILINRASNEGMIETVRSKEKDKYYLVTVKCGHVGRHRYMPITFPIQATSKKEAVELVRKFPRVKRNHKDFVLDIKEVSMDTYNTKCQENKNDPYLQIKRKQDQNRIFEDIEHRLIDEPNYKRRT